MQYSCCKILHMLLLCALLFLSDSLAQGIVINEIMASNDTTLVDDDGDSVDWLELFNSSAEPVNLSGYGLSDDPNQPFRWVFPPLELQPNDFLLVFASDKDRRDPTKPLHTNFKIKASGEPLTLTNTNGTLLDSANAGALNTDISFGRLPDGSTNWQLLSVATPGVSNDTTLVLPKVSAPTFSAPPGFYSGPFQLHIQSTMKNATIYFTTDGSLPDSSSFVYTEPLRFDTTVVVRAQAVLSNAEPSEVVNSTFIINETFTIPVVSLTTDPYNLWDMDYGIYSKGRSYNSRYPYKGANFWREWERPIYIEFFEPDGQLVMAENAGVRIFGHFSVGAPFKPLVFYARNEYGAGKFKYQIFPDKEIYDFEAFMLRNSGNDWTRTLFRDALAHQLASEIGLPVQAYRPAVVFINGVYWGIQNLRERMNEHYVESNFGTDSENIDLIAWNYGFKVYNGDSLHYVRLRDYVQSHDMADPQFYQVVRDQIHLDNFVDYFASEIFMGNRDWPHNNLHVWRPRDPDGRWMWMIKDIDHGFGYLAPYTTNTLRINALKDEFFPHLLQNESFRHKFINRMAVLMNTLFKPDHVVEQIDLFKSRLQPEIERHLLRWAGAETYNDPPTTKSEWNAYCNQLYEFAENRAPYVQKDIIEHFGLSGMAQLRIDVNDSLMGTVKVEHTSLPHLFSGDFFRDVPIRISAKAFTGYRFVGWHGTNSISDSLTLTLNSDTTLTALFEPLNQHGISVVINEINYNSASTFDVPDWIELANPNDTDIDVSHWTLRDSQDDHSYRLPWGTRIPANSFLVVARNRDKFKTFFPHVEPVLGDLGFGLSSSGDQVRLFDDFGLLVDSVAYDTKSPWPTRANGKGATLALTFPLAENSGPEHWFASYPNGTPGIANIRIVMFEFIQFTANVNKDPNGILIKWQFGSQPMFDDMSLQCKIANQGWQTIARFGDFQREKNRTFSFLDANPGASVNELQYRLLIKNSQGQVSASKAVKVNSTKQHDLSLSTFPNPFNFSTKISFNVGHPGFVTVELYNLRGQLVDVLLSKHLQAGKFHLDWSANDLPSGLYFCRLKTESTEKIFKLTLQK